MCTTCLLYLIKKYITLGFLPEFYGVLNGFEQGSEARTFLFNRYLTICVEKTRRKCQSSRNIHSIKENARKMTKIDENAIKTRSADEKWREIWHFLSSTKVKLYKRFTKGLIRMMTTVFEASTVLNETRRERCGDIDRSAKQKIKFDRKYENLSEWGERA